MRRLHVAKSSIHGKGVYASEDIKKGQVIGFIHGPIVVIKEFSKDISELTNDWIGFGKYSWINTDESIFRFINHSCDPNAYISTRRTVLAQTDIKRDTEIFLDYSLTECQPDWVIPDCQCKSKECRDTIGNLFSLSQSFITKNKNYIPKKFFDLYYRYHKLSPDTDLK